MQRRHSQREADAFFGYHYQLGHCTASASVPVSYTDARADRITSAGGVSYTPDANGNVVARGNDTFRYDAANRLISASVGLQS